MLSSEQKEELLVTARSSKLKKDLEQVSKKRYNPFVINGQIDIDRYLTFLNEYNLFVDHRPRPFRKIIAKDIRL